MNINLLPPTLTWSGLLLVVCLVPCYGSSTDEANYKYLKGLDIEELIKVEVTLDDVFDVFDGLVKAKKVSIATGNKQSTARAPAVTTVITAQDIEASGATDLDDVLAMVPGLHVSRAANLYWPIYTIRGMHSETNPEVLVLVNGIPITFLQMGGKGVVPWGGMPINMISRIEVIRGPGSAVYGADAYSGVINILIKTKDDIKDTEVGTRIGSFNTYEGWVLHGNSWNGFDIAAGLEYRTTAGQTGTIQRDAQTEYDRLFKTNASLAPGQVNTGVDSLDARLDIKTDQWQARAGYQGRYHSGTAVGAAQALDPVGYVSGSRANVDLTYHNPIFTPHWDVTAQISFFEIDAKEHLILFPPGAMGGAYPNGMIAIPGVFDRNLRLDTFAFYSGLQKHLFRIGVGYYYGDQYKVTHGANYGIDPTTEKPLPLGSPIIDLTDTPYSFAQEKIRKNQYLSIQDTWTMTNEWELTAGIRYDDYSDFGKTINPRVAFVWQPRVDLTGKLLYGRAFRAPAFTEMYSINNPVWQGNPDIKPETVNTWELAIDYRLKENLHLATNLFHYKATDKIQLIATPDASAIMFQNMGVLEGNGFELEARWKPNKWSSLLANYSYTKATDKTANHDAGYYPRQTAYVRTDWLLIPNWYLDVQAKWVADRQRTLGDPRSPVADYTKVDLTLRYKNILEGQTDLAFSVRNLFNADAREPSLGPDSAGIIGIPDDLPLAKRNWFVEFRYRF